MQENNLLTINQVSDLLNIPKPTLRFWEKELDGIIVPLRTNGGQRRYIPENISMIEKIKRMREEGMSLAEIKRRLTNSGKVSGDHSNSNRIDLLAERVAEVVKAEVSKFLEGE